MITSSMPWFVQYFANFACTSATLIALTQQGGPSSSCCREGPPAAVAGGPPSPKIALRLLLALYLYITVLVRSTRMLPLAQGAARAAPCRRSALCRRPPGRRAAAARAGIYDPFGNERTWVEYSQNELTKIQSCEYIKKPVSLKR